MANEIFVGVPGSPDILRFRETVRLGRAQDNGIVVDDEYVSSAHLELRREGEDWTLVDLGSTNGTFIDGERVTRKRLGAKTHVRLGHPAGADLLITIPGLAQRDRTRALSTGAMVDRYLGDAEPEDMSERTRVLRATLQEQRREDTRAWLLRTRYLRIAVGVLLIASIAGGGFSLWQSSRVKAQRQAAADLFHTIKALELDVRRLEAAAGPDASVREQQSRLEAQYEDLLTTLGIYSDGTPEEVQLIYRTVHRLGESEVTVPREFVDEVIEHIEEWQAEDLEAGLQRASANNLAPVVSDILAAHNLPRDFFFLALQESKLDPRAIGPSTRFGIAKGMWQFIPGTAEAYGLRLGPLQGERRYDPQDERHDVAKATEAAARYLADIYETDAQASGLLVMAAYNMGETRLLQMIRSMPESPAERNFWALIEQYPDRIPEETYNYVYRIVSAAVIGQDPELFGFDFDPPLADALDGGG